MFCGSCFRGYLFWYIIPAYLTDEAARTGSVLSPTLIPREVVAVVIIIAGIYHLKGLNDELNKENHDIPSPPYLENKEK